MDIPTKWREKLAGAIFEPQVIGESGADVFRVRCKTGNQLFLKSVSAVLQSELVGEAERLRWMTRLGLPGPSVLDEATEHDRHWLLMTAVPGLDLASANHLAPHQIIKTLAAALHCLHSVPSETCPFGTSLDERIVAADNRVRKGLVDESDFDKAFQGRTARELLAELWSTRPDTYDRVVVHGDACLPNFIVDGHTFAGFIDCGRLGVSDRYQDLSLTARSIARNLGQQWVDPFFREYGVEPDPQRIAFFCALDELF